MEKGEKMVDTTHSYNRNHSTTGIILKNKGKSMEHVASAVLIMSMISKKYGKEMEEMEKILSVLMQGQHQRWVPLSLILIQEKAKGLYEDLKKKHSEESRAGHCWFHQFKARANIIMWKYVVRQWVQIH